MHRITVVLADDHDIVREGIARLVESFGNIEIVGQAGDGYEAIVRAREMKPDIMLLDISMPKLRGVEAISEIKKVSPRTKIIVVSMHDKERYIKDCMRNGASAYLLKASAVHELKYAIEYVMKDQIFLSPAISQNVINDWLSDAGAVTLKNALTVREREILKLLAEGYSNKQVASMLFISPKTVETHRHRINEKLKLGSVADLVRYAIKEGLISV